MNLPTLPALNTDSASLQDAKELLLELRQSLQQVCRDVDERLRALEGFQYDGNHVNNSMENAGLRSEEIKSSTQAMETRMVMEATAPCAMTADLEQTTLEELNAALAKAFAQMAGRMVW